MIVYLLLRGMAVAVGLAAVVAVSAAMAALIGVGATIAAVAVFGYWLCTPEEDPR